MSSEQVILLSIDENFEPVEIDGSDVKVDLRNKVALTSAEVSKLVRLLARVEGEDGNITVSGNTKEVDQLLRTCKLDSRLGILVEADTKDSTTPESSLFKTLRELAATLLQ